MTASRPHLLCITRTDLEPTNRLLEAACSAREVAFLPVTPGRLGESGLRDQRGARLLYRAATDVASIYLEQLLHGPGVASFYDPHFLCSHPAITLQRAGVPGARRVYLPAADRRELGAQIEWLGGFPVVVKLPATEGGHGVLRAEDRGALEQHLRSAQTGSYLEAFVPHGRTYRLLVVGKKVVACTASAPGAEDFRSNGEGSRDLGPATPPDDALDIARRATAALRLELGGVDLMEADDGRLFVAEVNCPCYFAGQQQATGQDLAGMMVDHLLARSRAAARGL